MLKIINKNDTLVPLKNSIKIKAVNGGSVDINQCFKVTLEIANQPFEQIVYVTKHDLFNSYDLILGFDFLKYRSVILNLEKGSLDLLGVNVPILQTELRSFNSSLQNISLKLSKKVLLPPNQELTVDVKAPVLLHSSVSAEIVGSHKLKSKNVDISEKSVCIDGQTNQTHVKLVNNSQDIIMLNKNMKICDINSFDDLPINNLDEFPDEMQINSEMPPELNCKDFQLNLIDPQVKKKLIETLLIHKNVFARSTSELTSANTEFHRIELMHNDPVKCPVYKIPFNLRGELRQQITDLCTAGIISKSKSPYNAPALFVKQKNKYRLVFDFRRLNEITITQDFVIPTLDDILHEISGSNYFSALDMKSAFNQIPLHPDDRHKTAFSTPDGDKFEFNRLCFGLKNSPKAFQSIAQEILGDLLHNGAIVYIDDVFLHTKTIKDHFALINEVLDRFEKANLKFNPQKCQFLTKSCKFLGFVVTPEGVLIDKDKTTTINDFPQPKDQKSIKSFLGCVNFYRRYIRNFAKRALPLTNLLRKDVPFEWNEEAQASFEDIKRAILSPPVLALPDPSAELQITTDASSQGIGAVLEQRYPNGEVKPLYFYSKKLNNSQSKYSATVLEFFAIYSALNFFRAFLIGRKFKVFSDHKPLQGFLSNKNPSSKILRWKLSLEEFNYQIEYIKGSLNPVADHLSRCVYAFSIIFPDINELKQLQHNDEKLMKIIDGINKGDPKLCENYLIDSRGILIRLSRRPKKSPRSEPRRQVCVPHSLKPKILESVHSEIGGHLRFFKTYHRLAENFFWPNMYKDVNNFVRSCTACLSRRSASKVSTAPNVPVDQSEFPGERCHMDVFGPLKPTKNKNIYVLSAIDAFSKFIHLIPLPDLKSQTVARAFFDNYIIHRGSPHTLITDNASYFKSKEFGEFCKIQGIEKRHISAYSAHVNGRIEKTNQSLANILATLSSNDENWDVLLPQTMLALNSAIHEATHASPFFLEHGRDIRLPYCLNEQPDSQSKSEYITKLVTSLDTVFVKVLQNLKEQEEKQIHRSEIGKRQENFDYSVGSLCFIKTPNLKTKSSQKLNSKFQGPFRVIERFSKVNYKVRLVNNPRKVFNTHVNRMSPYVQRFDYLHIKKTDIDEDLGNLDVNQQHEYNLRSCN